MQARRLAPAEALCRDILHSHPDHAPTLHLYGLVAYHAGNLTAAIDLLLRAIVADGGVALYHCNLGEIYRLSGQADAALTAGRAALQRDPDLPQAHNNIGILFYERDAFDEAIAHYRRAAAIAPNYAEAWSNLGNALRAQKNHDEAIAAYRRARELNPNYADAISNMGTALRDVGRLEEAEAAYRQALALKPGDPNILNNLALMLRDAEQFDEAAALLYRSLSADPNNVKTPTYLTLVRLEQKRVGEAETAAARALALGPDDAEALNAMGLVRNEQQKPGEALALFRRALALEPDLADAHNNIGNILREEGEFDAACEAFTSAIALKPREAAYHFNLADVRKFAAGDPRLARMEELARDAAAPVAQMRLNFALAKAYDDLGRYDEAFDRLQAGNAQKRARIGYDEALTFDRFERVAESFDRARLTSGLIGCRSDLPVFVLGMPRSGTTLVEQILASHPDVHGAGELIDFGRLADQMCDASGNPCRFPDDAAKLAGDQFGVLGQAYVARLRALAPAARRVTDKMPANFMYLGLIHLALPDARIIHVRRDPRDTCLSCYSKLFSAPQDFTYDLAELGRYYRRYDALMAHWLAALPPGRMLDVRYDDVVADLEGSARRLIAHCGLAWDPACLAFHESRRVIRTASATQVRAPIYRSSEGRWRRYEAGLQPLIAALGDLIGPDSV